MAEDDPFGFEAEASPVPATEDDDPFGMGGDAGSFAPPLESNPVSLSDTADAEPSVDAPEVTPSFDAPDTTDMFEAPAPVSFDDSTPPAFGGGLGDEFTSTEMGPLAKWRIEQEEKIAAKAAAAATALQARLDEAQEELAAFYAERSDTTAKRASSNRATEAEYVEQRDAAMVADSWSSVASMVDLKEKTGADVKDTSRMRGLLVQLKHEA